MFCKSVLKRVLRLNAVPVPVDDRARTIDNAVLLPLVLRLIDEGHTATLPLRGNSMRPFLCHQRDKAILTRLPELRVGLPVLAEIEPGQYVLHRIVRIKGDHVTLRGDGNMGVEHCRCADVKALAKGFFRKGRSAPDLITSRKWRVYSWLWLRLLPVRRPLLRLHHIFFRSLKVLD